MLFATSGSACVLFPAVADAWWSHQPSQPQASWPLQLLMTGIIITSCFGGRLSLKMCFHGHSCFWLPSIVLSSLTSSHVFITFQFFVSFLVWPELQAAVPEFFSNQLFLPTLTATCELPSSSGPTAWSSLVIFLACASTVPPSLAECRQFHILRLVCVPVPALTT